MRYSLFSKYIILIGLSLSIACGQVQEKPVSGKNPEALVVFLVRHGEKVDQSSDPDLSPAGYVRAATLAFTLRSCQIEFVHSTDFIRTRKTAEPSASVNDLEIDFYDPSDLKSFSKDLLQRGGRHLVVGHSNTTPRLVELLGGDPQSEIDEYDEYDRLYVVTILDAGRVSTVLMRYGVPYVPEFQ